MTASTTRRTAITALGAGAAGLASFSLFAPQAALAAISSAAGVVGGGSLEGPNGPVQFSVFGSRMELDDASEPVLQGALAWFDPAGMDGEPLSFSLVSVTTYGPSEFENVRLMTGMVSMNGDGEYPFALRLIDGGQIGAEPDTARLVVGNAAGELSGTPVSDDSGVDYDAVGDLTSGNIQIVTFV